MDNSGKQREFMYNLFDIVTHTHVVKKKFKQATSVHMRHMELVCVS